MVAVGGKRQALDSIMKELIKSAVIVFIGLLFILVLSSNGDQRLQHLPQTCESNDNVTSVIKKLIQTGRTSEARLLAHECLLILNNEMRLEYSPSLLNCCSGSSAIIIETYKTSKEKLYESDDYLQTITDNLNRNHNETTLSSYKDSKCIHSELMTAEIVAQPFASNNDIVYTRGSKIIEQWNACCSWSYSSASKCIDEDFCCVLEDGTDHHLILPALREPKIQIRLEDRAEVIEIEQEGLLQMYDVSGVLWPAGFLLGLCLSNPVKCGVEEVFAAISNAASQAFVLDLGTGLGFASIALSKTLRGVSPLPSVIAADISKSALDLTINNAYQNGVNNMITPKEIDYMNEESLLKLKNATSLSCGRGNSCKQQEREGFDIIVGSSLQLLFDGTQDGNAPLWLAIDTLLSRNNPSAIVIFSHVRSGIERIQVPDKSDFELVRRVSGDQFNMKTRDGNDSDFELVILRRRQRIQQ